SYVINGNLTVASGVTLTIGPNVNVVFRASLTIAAGATLNVSSGAALLADDLNYGSVALVVNGTLNATGARFTHTGSIFGLSALMVVNAGASLTATGNTF